MKQEKKRDIPPDLLDQLIEYAELGTIGFDEPGQREELLKQRKDGWQLEKVPGHIPVEDKETGFRAAVFRHDERKLHLVSLAGTDLKSREDWKTNFEQATGKIPEQYKQAFKLTQWAKKVARKLRHKIHVSGFSLGGGLATYAGVKNRLPVYAFNPADLGQGTRRDLGYQGRKLANELVQNFRVEGEILSKERGLISNLQKGKPVFGIQTRMRTRPMGKEFVIPANPEHNTVKRHYKENVVAGLRELEARQKNQRGKFPGGYIYDRDARKTPELHHTTHRGA